MASRPADHPLPCILRRHHGAGDGSQIAVDVAPSPVSLLVVVGWGVLLAYQVIQPTAPWHWLHVALFALVGWIWLWSGFWLQGPGPRQILEQVLRE